MELVFPTLTSLLFHLPVALVWLVGVAFALLFWQRHPRVSLLTVVAIALLFLDTLADTILNVAVPLSFYSQGMSATQIGLFFAAKNAITSIVAAIAWGLLIAAIFGWRKTSEAQ